MQLPCSMAQTYKKCRNNFNLLVKTVQVENQKWNKFLIISCAFVFVLVFIGFLMNLNVLFDYNLNSISYTA